MTNLNYHLQYIFCAKNDKLMCNHEQREYLLFKMKKPVFIMPNKNN